MKPVPKKIKYAIAGAILVPCFGRIALHGTGHEHDYYRFVVPFFVGGLAGFLIGLMKDRWLVVKAKQTETNTNLERKISALRQTERFLRQSEERHRTLFQNHHSAMLLVDPETADIVDANPAAAAYYGWNREELTSRKITDINTLSSEKVFRRIKRATKKGGCRFIFRHRLANGEVRNVEVFSGPISLQDKQLLFSIIHDITDRVHAESEREKLIVELREAAREIRTLQGIIPICSHCKSIRNDEGAWSGLEEYISGNSKAQFSHGICPDCLKKLYPDMEM